MQDVIDRIDNEPASFTADYSNHRQRNSKGLELEFTYSFDNSAEFMANVSYLQTQYFSPDYYTPELYQSPLVSEVLGKAYLLYPLRNSLSLNTALYYSGPKKGFESAQPSGSTTILDETLAYKIDMQSNIMFSVKNLFDASVIYPSYQAKHKGIEREGRNWLISYDRRF
jgi:outer membrane receptor protein involved in Fe transport